MSFLEVIDLCSDDETGEAEVNIVKQEPGLDQNIIQHKRKNKADCAQKHTLTYHGICQESPANGSLNAPHTGKSSPAVLGQVESVTNVPSCASKLPPAPLCRQFWKAGNYDDEQVSKLQLQSGQNHLRVHPKFLHSNATSHKWAFGAIAELLDNALDEVQNGASFVVVDKIVNPKDASPALLIHDDGGGMDPESMRRCMSFGFSAKKLKSAIGQYGNGFKTSTMRLGADVIVFSRHASKRTLTQSVGLLSYTFLRQTGHGRIVVPIVDYEFEPATGKLINSHSAENSSANLSVLLEWSPFGTETELLKQFDNMGHHGTKVIIYNLWCSDDGDLELDFESDPEDILIAGAPKIVQSSRQAKMISQHHIANRFPYSLRVYSSILYLKIPNHFRIILRGKVVEHHNLANDLKFPEFILYKPQIGGKKEGSVITTIGFLKEAPHVNIHGFSVYHKNRLILPFFRVVSQTNNRGRGVIGVLEADFIEPTHNKQDFEKTSLFQKLEARLKDMTLEYWDFHCGLIGYQQQKKISTARPPHSKASMQPVTMNPSSPILTSPRVASVSRQGESLASPVTSSMQGPTAKRKGPIHPLESERLKRQATTEENAVNDKRHHWEAQTANGIGNGLQDHEVENLTQENKKLHAQCLEYEKKEEELNEKAELLRLELGEVQREYERLLTEAAALEITVKEEKT